MLSKIIDFILFVIGAFFIAISLFPQGKTRVVGESYYTTEQGFLFAIGVAMVVSGFLIRKRKKNK